MLFLITDDYIRITEFLKLQVDKHATDPTIAITERMYRFKLQMEARYLGENIRAMICFVLIEQYFYHTHDVLGRRGDMLADSDVLILFPKPTGDRIVYTPDQQSVHKKDSLLIEYDSVFFCFYVFIHPRQILRLKDFTK